MTSNDPWPNWISQHHQALAERSYGHELNFVEKVLRWVPEIDPSWVTHEFPFQDASGRNRRVDFVLQHWSLQHPIAIEIDGRIKSGQPPSKAEHDDFFERQNALTFLDFRLLRFTNAQVGSNPVKIRRAISEAIGIEQLAALRLRGTQQASAHPATAAEEAANFELRPSATTNQGELEPLGTVEQAIPQGGHRPQHLKRILIGAAVLVGVVALFAVSIIALNGGIAPDDLGADSEGARCQPGQIDINSASVDQLVEIVEIGPARADQIVAMRPFSSVNELSRIDGIGEGRLKAILEEGLACAA